jgi:hypothetical protein
MRQSRVKIGESFENTFKGTEWDVVRISPKIKWSGKGRNNIEKIKNVNYKVEEFYPLDETVWVKYDIVNRNDGRKRELKKYKINNLRKWTLYSEPFFKVSNREQLGKITKEQYNSFLNEFFFYNNDKGFFKNVISMMTKGCEGIKFEDGFIPMENIEFRTIISKRAWSGYDRIQIEFKVK